MVGWAGDVKAGNALPGGGHHADEPVAERQQHQHLQQHEHQHEPHHQQQAQQQQQLQQQQQQQQHNQQQLPLQPQHAQDQVHVPYQGDVDAAAASPAPPPSSSLHGHRSNVSPPLHPPPVHRDGIALTHAAHHAVVDATHLLAHTPALAPPPSASHHSGQGIHPLFSPGHGDGHLPPPHPPRSGAGAHSAATTLPRMHLLRAGSHSDVTQGSGGALPASTSPTTSATGSSPASGASPAELPSQGSPSDTGGGDAAGTVGGNAVLTALSGTSTGSAGACAASPENVRFNSEVNTALAASVASTSGILAGSDEGSSSSRSSFRGIGDDGLVGTECSAVPGATGSAELEEFVGGGGGGSRASGRVSSSSSDSSSSSISGGGGSESGSDSPLLAGMRSFDTTGAKGAGAAVHDSGGATHSVRKDGHDGVDVDGSAGSFGGESGGTPPLVDGTTSGDGGISADNVTVVVGTDGGSSSSTSASGAASDAVSVLAQARKSSRSNPRRPSPVLWLDLKSGPSPPRHPHSDGSRTTASGAPPSLLPILLRGGPDGLAASATTATAVLASSGPSVDSVCGPSTTGRGDGTLPLEANAGTGANDTAANSMVPTVASSQITTAQPTSAGTVSSTSTTVVSSVAESHGAVASTIPLSSAIPELSSSTQPLLSGDSPALSLSAHSTPIAVIPSLPPLTLRAVPIVALDSSVSPVDHGVVTVGRSDTGSSTHASSLSVTGGPAPVLLSSAVPDAGVNVSHVTSARVPFTPAGAPVTNRRGFGGVGGGGHGHRVSFDFTGELDGDAERAGTRCVVMFVVAMSVMVVLAFVVKLMGGGAVVVGGGVVGYGVGINCCALED